MWVLIHLDGRCIGCDVLNVRRCIRVDAVKLCLLVNHAPASQILTEVYTELWDGVK